MCLESNFTQEEFQAAIKSYEDRASALKEQLAAIRTRPALDASPIHFMLQKSKAECIRVTISLKKQAL